MLWHEYETVEEREIAIAELIMAELMAEDLNPYSDLCFYAQLYGHERRS